MLERKKNISIKVINYTSIHGSVTNIKESESPEVHWLDWLKSSAKAAVEKVKTDGVLGSVKNIFANWTIGYAVRTFGPYAYQTLLTYINQMQVRSSMLESKIQQMKILNEQKEVIKNLEMQVRVLLEKLSHMSLELSTLQNQLSHQYSGTYILLFVFFAVTVLLIVLAVIIIISALKNGNTTHDGSIGKILAQMIPYIMASSNRENNSNALRIENNNNKSL